MRPWLRVCAAVAAVCAPAFADNTAVLPFVNVSAASVPNSGNLDWIGESIAETLREALGSKGLLTLERDDIQEAFRRLQLRERAELTHASILKLGEAVDAEQIVQGRFALLPPATGSSGKGSLKIQMHVFDRRRLRESPEFSESGALEDLASVEAHLAWRALSVIAPEKTPPEAEFRTLRPPVRLDARENYIRGIMATTPELKEKYFSQAARLEPGFAHANFQLGKLHYGRKEYRQAVEWLEKVDMSDIHFRDASFLLGLARYQSGDFAGAQTAFEAVAKVVPLSEVVNNLGAAESRRNLPQAVDDFRRALEGDPNDPDYHFNLAYALFKSNKFEEAANGFRAVLDRNPQDQMATLLLGRCLKRQGLRSGAAAAADARLQALERLKLTYEERAYRQLKSMLEQPAK